MGHADGQSDSDARYRFFCDPLCDGAVLSEDQTHHALHVLRLPNGAAVLVFDGRGGSAAATLHTTRRQASVHLEGPIEITPSPPPGLTLATAQPRHDRAAWLVEQASQLNVRRLLWLDCARGTVKQSAHDEKLDKWRRLAIESAKQCHRLWVLEIAPPQSLEQTLAGDEIKLWLDPRAAGDDGLTAGVLPATALIGPEGGWSAAETALLSRSPRVMPIALGPTILRIETACAAIAARCLRATPSERPSSAG